MPGYRLYFLDPDSGRFEKAQQLYSADDVGAICLAQEHLGPNLLELWCEERMVARMGAVAAPRRPLQSDAESAFR